MQKKHRKTETSTFINIIITIVYIPSSSMSSVASPIMNNVVIIYNISKIVITDVMLVLVTGVIIIFIIINFNENEI